MLFRSPYKFAPVRPVFQGGQRRSGDFGRKDGNLRVVYARIGRCQGRPAWRGAQAAVAQPYPAVTRHVRVNGRLLCLRGRPPLQVTRSTGRVRSREGLCRHALPPRPSNEWNDVLADGVVVGRRLSASSSVNRGPFTRPAFVTPRAPIGPSALARGAAFPESAWLPTGGSLNRSATFPCIQS